MHQSVMEMNVFEAILARRSVRSYTRKEVDHAQLRTLLEAAVRAPTAMRREPWVFAVIQDRPLLNRVSELARPMFLEEIRHAGKSYEDTVLEMFSKPDFDIFHGAGTLVIIGSRAEGMFVDADCWLAAGNLMLAACAIGLGSCIIGSVLPALRLKEVKQMLGLPERYFSIAPIVLGYSCGEMMSVPRNKPVVLTGQFDRQ